MLEEVMYGLIDILGPIANFKNIHRQLADEALNAISKALNETSLYYRDIELGITPDPSQEKKAMLVRLWAEAAIPMRVIDFHLSQICELKSEYWLNPKSWSNEKIHEIGIDLESIKEIYRLRLLDR